jgi:NAD+ kinase
MDFKTIGLIANASKAGVAELLQTVRAEIARTGLDARLERRTARLLGEGDGWPLGQLARESDLLVLMGGDGTLLQMVHEAGFPIAPVLGVNVGTLGFLTGVGPAEFPRVWGEIQRGESVVSPRTMLMVEVLREGEVQRTEYALNEAVLSRGERSRLIRLRVEIDGVSLTEYNADGLIVATPTGSTAYSLSAGGPLLAPDSGVFVITPICPHVLTNRSVIVSDQAVITVQSVSLRHSVSLTSDGRDSLGLEPGSVVRIRRAPEVLRLVCSPNVSFFELLRQKLKWSGTVI